MSAATAIGMVSESLQNLLTGEMALAPTVPVTILAPDETGGSRRVNLFLYKLQENPAFKNGDWQVKPGDPTRLVPPPLSLNLFYLMTVYAANDAQTGNAAAHEILGEAMRVLYENPIVPEDYLADGLKEAREQIKVFHNMLDMDELSKIWSTFTQPFRLSVLYEVSVVQIDQLPASERPLPQRVRRIGVPSVQAPFRPPVLASIVPRSGPAGTVVTLRGRNLANWRAYVSISGRQVLNGLALGDDQFTLTIPSDLQRGFHEIRADVSHLFRTTFFFELTP